MLDMYNILFFLVENGEKHVCLFKNGLTTYVLRRRWGREVPRQPYGERRMPSFRGKKSRGAFGQLAFFVFIGGKSHDHRRFRKRGFFKAEVYLAKRLFNITEILNLRKNISYHK